jgi:hypothetical protein
MHEVPEESKFSYQFTLEHNNLFDFSLECHEKHHLCSKKTGRPVIL